MAKKCQKLSFWLFLIRRDPLKMALFGRKNDFLTSKPKKWISREILVRKMGSIIKTKNLPFLGHFGSNLGQIWTFFDFFHFFSFFFVFWLFELFWIFWLFKNIFGHFLAIFGPKWPNFDQKWPKKRKPDFCQHIH